MQDSLTTLWLLVSRQAVVTACSGHTACRASLFCQDQKRDDARHPGGNDWHPVRASSSQGFAHLDRCFHWDALESYKLCHDAFNDLRGFVLALHWKGG